MIIRRRKYILSILIVCISLCLLMGMAKSKEDELKFYIGTSDIMNLLDEQSYDGHDYCPVEMDISIWAPIEGEDMNLDKMIALAEEGYQFINPQKDCITVDISIRELKKVTIKGKDKEGLSYDVIVTNGEIPGGYGPSYSTHMVINVVDKLEGNEAPSENHEEIIRNIENYLYDKGAKPGTFISLKGIFKGELNKKERKALANAIAKRLRGSYIKSIEDGTLISLSGYSPILDIDSIGNTNFQIALRYNDSIGITYIWVGTPVIAIEY